MHLDLARPIKFTPGTRPASTSGQIREYTDASTNRDRRETHPCVTAPSCRLRSMMWLYAFAQEPRLIVAQRSSCINAGPSEGQKSSNWATQLDKGRQ